MSGADGLKIGGTTINDAEILLVNKVNGVTYPITLNSLLSNVSVAKLLIMGLSQ